MVLIQWRYRAPHTFATVKEAEAYLSACHREVHRLGKLIGAIETEVSRCSSFAVTRRQYLRRRLRDRMARLDKVRRAIGQLSSSAALDDGETTPP